MDDRVLLRQVHPLKLAADILASLISNTLLWRHRRFAGIAVHIAARIADLAGPGEVLVSSTVKDLVVGSQIDFVDRGVRALKGVPGEWRLFAVSNVADA